MKAGFTQHSDLTFYHYLSITYIIVHLHYLTVEHEVNKTGTKILPSFFVTIP